MTEEKQKLIDITKTSVITGNSLLYISKNNIDNSIEWDDVKNDIGIAARSILTRTTDYTILDSSIYNQIICNPNTAAQYGQLEITLPSASNNEGSDFIITYGYNGNVNGGLVQISTQLSDKIYIADEDIASLLLFHPGNFINVFSDGTNWCVYKHRIEIDTKYNNRSDWTNKEVGMIPLTYDNLSGTVLVGSTVTESGGNACTGVVASDSGTQLLLYNITNGGIFTNNNTLTFSNGATALVNEIVNNNNKNQSSVIQHNLGLSFINLKTDIYISTDGTDSTGIYLVPNYDTGLSSRGFSVVNVDNNSIKTRLGVNGIVFINKSGVSTAYGNPNDNYIRQIIRVR